jgi:predicted ATP-grasp superfamily ATP-dependent carboligase
MRIASPSAPVVRSVLEKNLTLDVARQCGVEVPQEYVLPSRVHLHDARDDLQFPLVAKPRDKTCEADFKVRYYHEFSEIDEAFARDDSFGARHLLQRYVPGEGVLVGVVMDHSTAVAVVQHRRITELPATGGVSVLAETEPVHPKAERDSVALLDALGWHGVAAVEFRHDRATDRWVLMEVNGRFWGQHVITQHAGIDFPWLAWRLAHGETITERYTARTGVRTLWLAGDLRRAHGLAHASTAAPDRPSAVRGIRDLLVDLAAAHHTALGDWSDPRPLIDEITRTVRTIVMDETKQIARALLPRHAWSALRAIRRGPPPTHT